MKKTLSLILVLVLLFSALSLTANAAIYDDYTWLLNYYLFGNGGTDNGGDRYYYKKVLSEHHIENPNNGWLPEVTASDCPYDAPEGMKFRCWTNYCGSVFYYADQPEETSYEAEAFLYDHECRTTWAVQDFHNLNYKLYAVWDSVDTPETYTVGFCSLIPGKARKGSEYTSHYQSDTFLRALPVPGQYLEKGQKATQPVLESNIYTYYYKIVYSSATIECEESYSFEGWYVDKDFTEPYDFDTPVTGNLTLYAKWERVTDNELKTATFVSNGGGKGAVLDAGAVYDYDETKEISYIIKVKTNKDEQLTVPKCSFAAPENKVFDCWLCDGQRYDPGDTVVMNTDKTFTANWKEIDYNIYTARFDANCGIGIQNDIKVKQNEMLTLPECTFTAPGGMYFIGWQNGSNIYSAGDKIAVTEDMTFTAVWKVPDPVAITSAGCIVTPPYTDDEPNYSVMSLDNDAYTAKISSWYLSAGRNSRTLSPEDTFEAGKKYRAYVTFTAKNGYAFAEDAVYKINGMTATKGERGTYYVEFTAVDAPSYTVGDANNDGRITIKDALAIQRDIADIEPIFYWKAGDFNCDDVLDIKDVTLLQKYIADFKYIF